LNPSASRRSTAQASAEGAELGVDLVLQPFGSLLHHGRPATINEVFATVKQEALEPQPEILKRPDWGHSLVNL